MTKQFDASSSKTPYEPAAPAYTGTATGCTLSNGVKEVYYTIENSQSAADSEGFTVSKAYVDIVLQDEISIADKKFCQKAASVSNPNLPSQTKPAEVQQAEALVASTANALTAANKAKTDADAKVTAATADIKTK